MKKNKKSFDAVHMMREIRDRLGEQYNDMTFEEQKQYIKERLSSKPTKAQPRSGSAQPLGRSPMGAGTP